MRSFDARLVYETHDRRYSLGVYANNLFDRRLQDRRPGIFEHRQHPHRLLRRAPDLLRPRGRPFLVGARRPAPSPGRGRGGGRRQRESTAPRLPVAGSRLTPGRHETQARKAAAASFSILLLAYIFNFIDRQIIGVLAVPIRSEFGLSDTALGTLGVAFGSSTRRSPSRSPGSPTAGAGCAIIAASVGLWSLFTAACGLAQNFWQLFLARMGVGIGEAGGIAPSYALIADFYPKEKRARALAFFSLGIPIGSALGVFFGGWIASHLDWRSAFLIVGLAGLPAALLVRLFVPEPVRGGFDAPTAPRARRRRPSRGRRRAGAQRRASGCSPSAPPRARSSATA